MASDPALGLLASRRVRADGIALVPTGVDALVCCLARPLLGGRQGGVAFALPRGRVGTPAMLGLYLVMQRWGLPHVHGSVLVATAQTTLSAELRNLTVEGVRFDRLRVGRLVSRPKPSRPQVREAMMRPLDRGPAARLSQDDGYLLFGRVGSIPTPPARGVVSLAVVDTNGAARPRPGDTADFDSPDAWSTADRVLGAAGARVAWIGELGDVVFEAFCAERAIPLVRLDWPLLQQAAQFERFRDEGAGVLNASGLCRRALGRPPVALRVVHDSERDLHAREAYVLLAKMCRQGRTKPLPEPVRAAYELLAILSRLASPLDDYEAAAGVGSPVFNRSAAALWRTVRHADSSQFRGERWKEGYRRHWDSLVGAVGSIYRAAAEEPTKLHALFDELATAKRGGRELVCCVQTQTERRALIQTLQDLGIDEGVVVATFAKRADAGPGDAPRRTVLLGPPPPWQAPLLLSGERGDTVALCYPFEEAKLRGAVGAAEAQFGDDRTNAAVLDRLGIASGSTNGWLPSDDDHVVALEDFGEPDDIPESSAVTPLPDPEDRSLWQDLVDLWGADIDPGVGRAPVGDECSTAGYDGMARIVHFENAPPVALRDDRPVDVIADADGDGLDDIVSKPPAELRVGEHIAFLAGTEHQSLRDALMAAWDETLAVERQLLEPLWRTAIESAVAKHGIAAVAARCGRHEGTVRSWADDRAAPQRSSDFEAVLRASEHDGAWQARAAIWTFLQTTRNVHRLIGKKLLAAVAESLSEAGDQPAVRDLEALTRTPVGDLLDTAEDLVVARVGPARPAALADCGHFLNPDHPLLQGDPA
jgi:hypothetical protein